MLIKNLYIRLTNLVPDPDCDTFGDEYDAIVWRDSRPLPTAAEIKVVSEGATLPKSKRAALNEGLMALTHDFGDGRTIQTRPQDETNIRNAIEVMGGQGMLSIGWRMEDNTVADVTLFELKTALSAGQLAGMQLWATYNS